MTAGGNSSRWYVALVKSCQEKKSSEALARLGVEHYLPVRKVVRKWSDRMKTVEMLLLPRMIFVRVDDDLRRRELLSDVFGLYAYMTVPGESRPLVVPDNQLEEFRGFVDRMNSSGGGSAPDIEVTSRIYAPGDRVRVVDGPLNGFEAECVDVVGRAGRKALIVRLGILGTASVEVDASDVEKI